VSFASDTNYLFSTGAQFRLGTADSASLEFFSNNTKRGEFLSSGNFVVDTDVLFVNASTDRVGIGTTAPSAKLHIADSVSGTIRVNAGTRNININSFAGDWNYQTSTGAPYVFGTQDSNILLLYTNNTEKVRITTAGNVGIGTNAPTVRLHIMAESEQVRTGFDASNYFSTTVASDGATTFNAVGAGASFVFSDGISLPYVAKTANYTLTSSDHTVDCTANSFTVTLPTAVGITGRIYNIKNSGTGSIVVNTTSSQTIDGQLTQTLTQYDALTVVSSGSVWIII
jgi:hypothetical protein